MSWKLYNAIATVLLCLKSKKQFTLWALNPSHIETKTAVVQNRIYLFQSTSQKKYIERNFTISKVYKKKSTIRHLVNGITSTLPDNNITARNYRYRFNLYLLETQLSWFWKHCLLRMTSSVARGGAGGAIDPPIGMSTKMQNGKKHHVFSTFETVLCSGVD